MQTSKLSTVRLSDRQRRIQFFRDHAGYCVGRRLLGAAALADAEIAAEDASVEYEWPWDDGADWSWMTEDELKVDHEVYMCQLRSEDGEYLAALCGIFDPDLTYKRVVEAELALEAIDALTASYAI